MLANQDVNASLIRAVRGGRLEEVRELINSFGLSYSRAWSEGYNLLRDAVKNGHAAVAKLLFTSGSKVNSNSINPSDTPLHFAVTKGDIEVVEMLLDRGANINAKNSYGATPLHNAIKIKRMKVTELLLKRRADVNARDDGGRSPLHVAIERGYLQIVEHLLKCRADVNVTDSEGASPLHVAVERGFLQIAEHLFKYGADVNCMYTSTWKKGYTPLHFAVENDNREVVGLLFSRGANVDVKGEDGITPLHLAVKKGYIHIAKDLLNRGACLDSSTLKEGYTALHFASQLSNEKVVKLLLREGAHVDVKGEDGMTPLHIATKRGDKTVVRLLLQYGAEVDNQDKDGKTTLHLAVEEGHLMIVDDVLKCCPDINNQSNRSFLKTAVLGYEEKYKRIVEALQGYGFNVNTEDADDSMLLHAAVEKGCLKIVEDLLKYGADVNVTSGNNFTPLHNAAIKDQEEVAKLLISYGADVNALDEAGKTPIFYAIENINSKITKLLLTNRANVKDSPELLNIAVDRASIEIVEALLQHGADINASDEYGRTALHFTVLSDSKCFIQCMCKKDMGEIAKLLLSKGANVDAQTANGVTTLHAAAQKGFVKVVETLLEYGSDINITSRNNRTPLDLAMERVDSRYELIAEALKRHKVKMKIANLRISEKNLLSVKSSDEMREFEDECGEEIARMKSEMINNTNISFHDILTEGIRSLAMYMRNENIVQVSKSDDYKTKLPIYATMIESNFRKGMERRELLEQANKSFHFVFNNFLEFPDDCTEEIFSYLSDQDLRILMDACKPLSISSLNTYSYQ